MILKTTFCLVNYIIKNEQGKKCLRYRITPFDLNKLYVKHCFHVHNILKDVILLDVYLFVTWC